MFIEKEFNIRIKIILILLWINLRLENKFQILIIKNNVHMTTKNIINAYWESIQNWIKIILNKN